jgi:hypothetical protein
MLGVMLPQGPALLRIGTRGKGRRERRSALWAGQKGHSSRCADESSPNVTEQPESGGKRLGRSNYDIFGCLAAVAQPE